MPKIPRVARLRLNPKALKKDSSKRGSLISENIGLGKPPDAIQNIPLVTRDRGIRNTQFRLPYLSNLKKMDPVFDDPYEVAAQTIAKTRKPGDGDVVLDPDGLYDMDEVNGEFDLDDEEYRGLKIHDEFEHISEKQRWASLIAATGLTREDIDRLRVRHLVRNFVSNQTRRGKIPSIFILTVVGDENGLVGFGEGKWGLGESARAQDKAMIQAIRSMAPVHRYENRTVLGDLEGKFKSTKVYLRPRAPGFGVRANYYVHEVFRCAGITDVGAKVRGSMNGMNIVKAVFEALRAQKLPETIAKQRGMHVVDVRQRYFNGR